MISKNDCILLGTLSKPHGTKGSLVIVFKEIGADNFRERGTAFVEFDGLLVPFSIEKFQERSGDTAIIQFEGIISETRAKEFAGLKVFVLKKQVRLRKKFLSGLPGSLSGYSVKDLHQGFVGLVKEITGIASNPLLRVTHGNREILVPFHEDIILEINDKDKIIVIHAPEGLFNL
jgi:16S rRNA processing protein RimM